MWKRCTKIVIVSIHSTPKEKKNNVTALMTKKNLSTRCSFLILINQCLRRMSTRDQQLKYFLNPPLPHASNTSVKGRSRKKKFHFLFEINIFFSWVISSICFPVTFWLYLLTNHSFWWNFKKYILLNDAIQCD